MYVSLLFVGIRTPQHHHIKWMECMVFLDIIHLLITPHAFLLRIHQGAIRPLHLITHPTIPVTLLLGITRIDMNGRRILVALLVHMTTGGVVHQGATVLRTVLLVLHPIPDVTHHLPILGIIPIWLHRT